MCQAVAAVGWGHGWCAARAACPYVYCCMRIKGMWLERTCRCPAGSLCVQYQWQEPSTSSSHCRCLPPQLGSSHPALALYVVLWPRIYLLHEAWDLF